MPRGDYIVRVREYRGRPRHSWTLWLPDGTITYGNARGMKQAVRQMQRAEERYRRHHRFDTPMIDPLLGER